LRERILYKIARIQEYLSIIDKIKNDCLKRFETDPIYRGSLIHYLYLVSDSCISLAEIVIRTKGLRQPQSYHEAIDVLGENNIIDPEFAYEFAGIAGFRNFLAHDYEKVQKDFICNTILPKMDDVKTFLEQVRNAL
jgi:uncharacterized protein YutE (UPF0331/DUF86 family)